MARTFLPLTNFLAVFCGGDFFCTACFFVEALATKNNSKHSTYLIKCLPYSWKIYSRDNNELHISIVVLSI